MANDSSVEVIEQLCDDEYDELLSKNVVFLKMVDCSAVNTILECMVYNTPVVVNRHPALEEALGSDYPGFYESMVDASNLLNSMRRIESMHLHLKKMDKTKYSLHNFVEKMQDAVEAHVHVPGTKRCNRRLHASPSPSLHVLCWR